MSKSDCVRPRAHGGGDPKQKAGTLSGGQWHMATIGRSLTSGLKQLVLDGPSFGLASMVVGEVARTVSELNRQGRTVLVVEQNSRMALRISIRADALGKCDHVRKACLGGLHRGDVAAPPGHPRGAVRQYFGDVRPLPSTEAMPSTACVASAGSR